MCCTVIANAQLNGHEHHNPIIDSSEYLVELDNSKVLKCAANAMALYWIYRAIKEGSDNGGDIFLLLSIIRHK
jgi:hypothetical protein